MKAPSGEREDPRRPGSGFGSEGVDAVGEPVGEAPDEVPLAPREAAFVRLEGKP